MAANNGETDSTGRKNYYNISYGMLSTNAKDAPEGYEKISLADIKSRRLKNENVDLRKKYYDSENGKDYPLRVFYTDIDGFIESVEKDEYSEGISLKVTLHDADGDESIVQTDFYGKVSADFLNRLVNVNTANSVNLRPYSIPSDFTPDRGEKVSYYNSGVSIKDEGVKIKRAFNKDNGLPANEQIKNTKGKMETSRVAQIDFLWEKVSEKFKSSTTEYSAEQPKQESTKEKTAKPEGKKETTETAKDDLPF